MARLELANWLAVRRTQVSATLSPTDSPIKGGADTTSAEKPVRNTQAHESPVPADAQTQDNPLLFDDAPVAISSDEQEPGPSSSGDTSRRQASTTESVRPSPLDQVEIFAKAMTAPDLWAEITAELATAVPDPAEASRQLAHHGWCDLFIGLVQVIEKCKKFVDQIPEWGKRIVKDAIHNSSIQSLRPAITDAIVDIVVDKVWAAFKGAAITKVPLLAVIDGDEAIRSLRILAVFSCPAPEDHEEVREHALKPLADDAAGLLTAQCKERLAKLFKEWVSEDAA
ncbi:hypothetical protein ACFWY9_19410 [Amycolatopsis sp. NPDC059027]|uniref:hypothetical protein n=1 Tax=Amycolatopsis sp. NPDC059027 TaxID=3346709 RepID=UPI003671AE0D